ncbi:hypothetical protein [Pseudomonas amygdali]|uniref:Uncharacterized protein n=2 Tax=Pseudomonas amygdali pv. lachrymans TaxID=53707 RepID=A0ABR5KQQ6_PSEAV|nr:hypothetical protein [Pseudomonas amygdali]AXH59670.1 hypothetical protein PLA107_031085 [Pseudomonas amygdali pv. lachrymans str. M301315]KPC17098.1 Uncharacterized protein AC499_0300 [Pseudomonas amygdali pv. lachrymans]KPC18057.1 Uncharacterized protein AC499_1259 [Pseudomonas amygdali pv. lachrymans]
MSNMSHQDHPSLYERLDYTFELLYEGINQNDAEKVDTALFALPQVMHDAIDARCYPLLGQVDRKMMAVFSEHKLLSKVVAGNVSEDILEQLMGHATPHVSDLAGMGRDRMSVRVGKLIAASMLKRYPKGLKDYQELLSPFTREKHLDTYKMIYTHLLKSTLLLSEDEYRKNHRINSSNLFDVTTMNDLEHFSPLLEAIAQVLFENQEIVLKHLDIQRQGTYIKSCPINIRMICKLHEMGFDRLADAWGPNIFHDQIEPKQMVHAEKAGIAIERDFAISKLLFKDNPSERLYASEDKIKIPVDAMVYALHSDQFTIDDLEEVRVRIAGSRDKVNKNLNLRMPSTLSLALRAIYGDPKMKEPSELLLQKTELMVAWALKNKPGPFHPEFTKTILELERFPKKILLAHPSLRETVFAADLGI